MVLLPPVRSVPGARAVADMPLSRLYPDIQNVLVDSRCAGRGKPSGTSRSPIFLKSFLLDAGSRWINHNVPMSSM